MCINKFVDINTKVGESMKYECIDTIRKSFVTTDKAKTSLVFR